MIEKPVIRLIIGMGVPIASALVLEQLPKTGVVEVPFAFEVEEQTLPPGTYTLKQSILGGGVRIKNEKVPGAGMKCVAAERKFGRAEGLRLVFNTHEGHYSLSEIWFDADGRGLILPAKRPATGEVRSLRFQ